MENTDTPKKLKARKELLEEADPALEVSGSSSPRKKLTDIANSSRVVNELTIRRFVDLLQDEPKPGCSKDMDGEIQKHSSNASNNSSLLQSALTSAAQHDATKPEPVKKRWLREACQDSSRWADDFGYPIQWEEDSSDGSEVKKITELQPSSSELRQQRELPYCVPPNGAAYPCLSSSLVCSEDTLDDKFLQYRSRKSPFSPFGSPGESSLEGRSTSRTGEIGFGGQGYEMDTKCFARVGRIRFASDESLNLNETRPTVLRHSGRLSFNASEVLAQRRPEEPCLWGQEKWAAGQEGGGQARGRKRTMSDSPGSCRAGKIGKQSEDEDFSTALALMELAKHPSSASFA